MKLSSNSISILIFTILAATVFFFMAKRPAVEGNALNFGMPMQSQAITTSDSEQVAPKVDAEITPKVKAEPETVPSTEVKSETTEPLEAAEKSVETELENDGAAANEAAPTEENEASIENEEQETNTEESATNPASNEPNSN